MSPRLRVLPPEKPIHIEDSQVFAPTRLALARERRGRTKKSLAEEIGVTADAITKYETASCRPTLEKAELCATALRFPLDWFYADDIELLDPSAPSFRSKRSMTAELRLKATRAGDLAASILSPFLHSKFLLPEGQVPDLAGETPEDAALYLRSQRGLGVGPISNVVHLLESLGIEVFWLNEASSSLDAWSVWHNDRPFVLLNQHTDAGCRARFDAAHELGHLVLHRHEKEIDGLTLEKEADRFAAALLMPPEQFFRECPMTPNLRAFFPLKKRWGVSIAAMLTQCQKNGHLSEWSTRRAWRDISANGWRMNEPAHLSIQRESSAIHPTLWKLVYDQGYAVATIARRLKINVDDLVELMPDAALAVPQPNEKPSSLRLVA